MKARERLQRVLRDIEKLQSDPAISPTPFSHLDTAAHAVREAGRFALDSGELYGSMIAEEVTPTR